MEFEPPTRVMLAVAWGTEPTVWKRPGIVKLVFDPTVGGFRTRPLNAILTVEAFKSRSLVVEIWLTATDVDLTNDTEAGIGVPAGTVERISWKNWSFREFTCESRSAT